MHRQIAGDGMVAGGRTQESRPKLLLARGIFDGLRLAGSVFPIVRLLLVC